jgi:hypothetical protein
MRTMQPFRDKHGDVRQTAQPNEMESKMSEYQQFGQSPRFSATGVATGSILAIIVAMAISVAVDVQPSNDAAHTAQAHNAASRA